MEKFEESADDLRRMQLQTFGKTLVALGTLVGAAANIALLSASWGFYRAAATIPVGTSVRPMGFVTCAFLIGAGSLLVGVPLSLIGSSICKKAMDRKGSVMGFRVMTLCLMPLPLALSLFYLIILIFGLKLAD